MRNLREGEGEGENRKHDCVDHCERASKMIVEGVTGQAVTDGSLKRNKAYCYTQNT